MIVTLLAGIIDLVIPDKDGSFNWFWMYATPLVLTVLVIVLVFLGYSAPVVGEIDGSPITLWNYLIPVSGFLAYLISKALTHKASNAVPIDRR